VKNILEAGQTRGEEVVELNQSLYENLRDLMVAGELGKMSGRYHEYLQRRGETYMAKETGSQHKAALDPRLAPALEGEGYAGVALDLIEGLDGVTPHTLILNTANLDSIDGMQEADVVEIPAKARESSVQPIRVGKIPEHCLGLMKQVKAYERLVIEAALEGSYSKAHLALTIHPLVMDRRKARQILDGYIVQHGGFFPALH
jgi:6-phospho-beta-glucosidase